MNRKICVVTGTRAEYGLLFWLIKSIENDPKLELQIIATGMHLSPEFGLTYREIEKDGFLIDKKIEMIISADTSQSISKSTGLGLIGFADAYIDLKPDIVVLLGDRYELLAASIAALFASAVLGGPRLSVPADLLGSVTTSPIAVIGLMLAPFIILLVVTLGSIRIIRRHDRDLWVPYGPAISLAALWVMASGQMFRPVGAIAAG